MVDWNAIFENHGVKRVSKNDRKKNAYVPNRGQLRAITAAGIKPSVERPAKQFDITVLGSARDSVGATYYHSQRKKIGRRPEPRLGTEIISEWLEVGDEVVIGNIGSQLFVARNQGFDDSDVEAAKAVARKASKASREALILNAQKAKGKPKKKTVIRSDYARSSAVVMGAIARADGKCEMPGCTCEAFNCSDGSVFLEVHHIKWLAQDGDDSLENAAALCPRHHRELHHGANRQILEKALSEYVRSVSS